MSGWASTTYLPPLLSAQVLGANAQPPTAFFTFPGRGRLWKASLSFAVATNTSYSAAVTQFYARLLTGSGIVLPAGPIELAVSNHNQAVNDGEAIDLGGILVGANDTLMLDVNNGLPVPGGGGVMRASCVVLYSLP